MKVFFPLFLLLACIAVHGPAAPLYHKVIQFSGYDWIVKESSSKVGPGPNFFSDGGDNVWVDSQGCLHLKITRRGSRWYCAEVISQQSFGHGTYRWHVASAAGSLDSNVVLGLFTWNDDPAFNHREIDIEFARWSNPKNQNSQYVVQPYDVPQNILRWSMSPTLTETTHSFMWLPNSVNFRSDTWQGSLLNEWTATNGIPQAGGENARMNLWLFRGRRPSDNREAEVVIDSFEFIPAP